MTAPTRDYNEIAARLSREGTRDERMRAVVDAIWEGLAATGVSWVGFYVDHPAEADDRRLILGPRRDKPACSPIGLHGVCGQALTSRRVRIVDDVRNLGEAYVACDPRDRSEIVLPLVDDEGRSWGVLDLDSWDAGSFDDRDEVGLRSVLAAVGFAVP
jgi:putative methionine-R-sulfoxide reductase with GAF domain